MLSTTMRVWDLATLTTTTSAGGRTRWGMLGWRTRLLLLAGRGLATPPPLLALPTLPLPARVNTSHAAAPARRHLRLGRGSLACESLSGTLRHRGGMLFASRHGGMSDSVRLASNTSITLDTRVAVESGLTELRMKLESLGHLNLTDVHQVVVSLEQCPEKLTNADCLQLLKYCCRMAEEEYRPCGSLVQRVWVLTTHRKSGQVTLEHLDLYLHLSLAVESTNISEKDVFDVMERHKLEPSARVFEALMMALGQRGHLEEALQVLAAMKERDVPVREATFAALILAYGADRDWEGVQGVLDTMKSVQMTLSEVTFGALGTASAMTGQMTKLRQVVAQARQDNKPLSSGQLEAILLAIIKSNNAGEHFKNIDLMMRLVDECGMKVDVSRVALRLIHSGHVMEALHLILSLPLLRTNSHLYSNATLYLREIVHARTDPALVVEVCQRLQQEDINRYALQVALEYALKEQWEQLAWVLLRVMREAGVPLREHYFWPLLHVKAINLEPAKLLGCVKAMLELGETPGFETLRDHIIPGLSLSQPRLTLQMLQNAGLSATAAATPLLVVLVKNNMMDQAVKFVKETRAPLNLGDILGTLAPAWHSKPKSIIALLALLIHRRKEQLSVNENDWGGQFLLSLVATRAGLGVHHIRPLFQEMRKHRIGVSEYSADLLMSRLSQPLQEAVRAALPLVLRAELGRPPLELNNNIPHPRSMSEAQLEGHLEELHAKGLNTRGSLRRLLLLRAAKNDSVGVMELMKSASEEGQRLSAGMLAGVLRAYVSNGHTQAAMDMFKHLRTEHPAFMLDSYKVVDLCTLLTQDGRGPEAMDILQDYIMESGGKKIDPKQIRRNCQNLLMVSASTNIGGPKETEKLLELLVLGGFVVPDNLSLGTLVKSRLNCGDLKGAVEEARRIYERYKCLPMRRELLIHLIDNHHSAGSESESVASCQLLDDMLSLIAEVRGSTSARHDLLFAYVEGGRPAEAGKVLKNLAGELNQKQVDHQLEYYVKTENEAAMMNFLLASRGVDAIDRQAAYSALLSIYYVQIEGQKGLSLWTSMQEEGHTPSPTFLSTLAALLAACKMKIPFQV